MEEPNSSCSLSASEAQCAVSLAWRYDVSSSCVCSPFTACLKCLQMLIVTGSLSLEALPSLPVCCTRFLVCSRCFLAWLILSADSSLTCNISTVILGPTFSFLPFYPHLPVLCATLALGLIPTTPPRSLLSHDGITGMPLRQRTSL